MRTQRSHVFRDTYLIILSSLHTVLTIGFRRERDSFSEPNTGTSQSREEVCVDVTEGVVGTTITIEAVFTPGTATGTHTRVTIVTIPYQTLSYSK